MSTLKNEVKNERVDNPQNRIKILSQCLILIFRSGGTVFLGRIAIARRVTSSARALQLTSSASMRRTDRRDSGGSSSRSSSPEVQDVLSIRQDPGSDVPSGKKSPSRWLDRKIFLLAFGSIGVVFGDIGTSLYAIKECFHGKHAIVPDPPISWGPVPRLLVDGRCGQHQYVTLSSVPTTGGGIFALLGLLSGSDRTVSPAFRPR